MVLTSAEVESLGGGGGEGGGNVFKRLLKPNPVLAPIFLRPPLRPG